MLVCVYAVCVCVFLYIYAVCVCVHLCTVWIIIVRSYPHSYSSFCVLRYQGEGHSCCVWTEIWQSRTQTLVLSILFICIWHITLHHHTIIISKTWNDTCTYSVEWRWFMHGVLFTVECVRACVRGRLCVCVCVCVCVYVHFSKQQHRWKLELNWRLDNGVPPVAGWGGYGHRFVSGVLTE